MVKFVGVQSYMPWIQLMLILLNNIVFQNLKIVAVEDLHPAIEIIIIKVYAYVLVEVIY